MTKYKTKVELIDAFIWTGGPDQDEDPEWICAEIKEGRAWVDKHPTKNYRCLYLYKHTGAVYAEPTDYVVKTANGKFDALTREEFKAKYELASD